MADVNPRLHEQQQNNRASRDAWQRFAEHRRHVMRHLASAEGGALCVLGAGNCNDLDLGQLTGRFDQVHLVDVDETALRDAVARQGADGCRLHAPVDVSGLMGLLGGDEAWKHPAAVLRRAAESPAPELPGPFDVVLSANLLTQLLDMAARSAPPRDELRDALLLALRRRHLELLQQLLAPGGAGWLVTDVVSSQTCPQLPEIDEQQLPQRLAGWIEQGNFFSGANPAAIARQLQQLGAAGVRLHPPWKWDLGPRWYAVAAISFRRV